MRFVRKVPDAAKGFAGLVTVDPANGTERALFSDAAREPLVAELKRNLFASRYQDAASMVDAAIERGELAADVDVREFVGLVMAPIYYRRLVTEEPLDYALANQAAATALIAVRAGACRT